MEYKKALFRGLLVSFLWSGEILISKYVLGQGVNPFSLLVQLYIFALVLLGIYLIGWKRDAFATISKPALPWLVTVGMVGSGLGIGLSYIRLSMTEVINI